MNPYQIAAYIRVSTEEQAENPEGSIKNQEERIREAIKYRNLNSSFGELVDVFIDRAKSGKDTNRPELQRLLRAIRERKVNLVMATELSRLSRSMKDFSEIWELMQKQKCSFQSLRENFDTTNAAGEMMLFSIMNFAQFERKQVAERVSANFVSRAKRGLYNGGVLPIGYRLIPEKAGFLEIDPKGQEVVRRAFDAFLKEGSLPAAARALNQAGVIIERKSQGGKKTRLGHFTFDNLYCILTNPAYIGIRSYKEKGIKKEAPALWEPIIERSQFEAVGKILKKNYRRKKPHSQKRYPYILSGLVSCSECGERLIGKSAWGNSGKVGYYDHSWSTKRHGSTVGKILKCTHHRVPAKLIEPRVWEEVMALLKEPKRAEEIFKLSKKKFSELQTRGEDKKIQGKIRDLESQIEVLAERLSSLPKSVSPTPIYRQMERLEAEKGEEEMRLRAYREAHPIAEEPAPLANFEAFLEGLRRLTNGAMGPELQARLIQKLVQKVEITRNGFRLHYFVGKDHCKAHILEREDMMSSRPEWAIPAGFSAKRFFAISGSNSIDNGGTTKNRTWN